MKKIVLFVLFLSLFSFANLICYTNVNYSTANALNIGIDIPEVELAEKDYRDGNTYSSIVLPNTGQLTVGKPDLPGLANWILIPNGTNVSISTFPGTPLIFENVDLAPVQEEPFDNVDSPFPPFAKDKVVYSTDTNYPGLFAEVESTKRKRGQECTILWVYPYQYNPIERTLTVYPDLEVSVNFNGVIKPIPANLINDRHIESLKGFAINAEAVLQAEESIPQTKTDRLERTDGCELLIITDPAYSYAASTLADWKTKRGIFTTVVTTTTTGSTVSSIENYIDNAYDNWTPAPSYFLFIGDVEDIPVQYLTNTGSDFYYADRDDPVDWVADLGYGRLSVDTSAQADSLVARIIRYEKSPSTNSSYYTDILNAACFQDGELYNTPPHELPDQTANRRFCKTSEDVRNYLATQGYSSQREYVAYNRVNNDEIFPFSWNNIFQAGTYIFENDDPPGGGVEIPDYMQKPTYNGFDWNGNTAGISSAYNNGVFFSLFRAHGSRSGWGDPDFNSNDVDALTNGEDRPIVWSITCQSGWFDHETDGDDGTTIECFAERWIRHSTGGSCGVLASSRNSSSGKNDRLIWGMMNAIWPDFDTYCSFSYGGSTPMYRMGDVKNYGMDYMSTHYSVADRQETIRLFHWFGDPTMEMWTSEPSQLTNAYATTDVNVGTSSMTVRIEPAVSGMQVCAYNENDDVFVIATTNSSGYAYLTFNNPLTEAMVNVTVTKHNYLPFEFRAGTNTWDGSVNRYWSQKANWSLNLVPEGENVLIPAVGYCNPMYIDYEDAECNDLTIESGVELQIKDQTLTVNGDLSVSGHVNMLENTATMTVMGNVDWESGSILTTTVNGTYINVYGNWDFSVGAIVNPTQGFIDFRGTSNSWIRCYSNNSSFFRLRIYKSGGAKAVVSNVSTEDLVINNLTYTTTGSIFESRSSHDIIMRGYFNYLGTFDFTLNSNTGSVIFDGTAQSINNYSTGSGIFNNVIFSASTSAYLVGQGITVAGDLTINQGNFNPANYDVTVGGNWTNTVGTAGFTEGTGRVIFDGGNFHQYCSSETFNELEVNKSLGGAFRIDGTDVICASYDWSAGAVDVLSGSFTANDLLDNAIQGGYYLNAGGTIDLNNSGSYVDLKGDVHIFGGTMTVVGSISDWPYGEAASIEMSSGVLDFPECGITLTTSYALTSDITGGTIKTAYSFTGNRADYNPTGGTLELHGSTDANLFLAAGSNLYNVNVNKSETDDLIAINQKTSKRERVRVDRVEAPVELTRSNTINITGDLNINGNLQIDSGALNLNGFNVDVLNDVRNYGSLTVAVSDTLNTGNDMYLYSGSVVDLSGTILLGTRPNYYGDAIHYTGSTFNQTDGDYFVETINLYNGSQFNGTGGITHMYVNGSSSSNTIAIDDPDSYFYQFYIDSGSSAEMLSCDYDLYVSGTTNLFAPLDINGFTLSTLYMNVKESGDLIINTNGVVDVRGNGPYMQSGGALTMTTDSELNSGLNIQFQAGSIENVSGGEIYLGGSFTNSSGIFTPTDGSVTFDGSSASSIFGTAAFHDLIIDKVGASVTTNAAFSMNDLVITSGILNPSGFDIEVAGDWTNNVGDAGFVEGTETVTFNGSYSSQITTDETFYNLAAANPAYTGWKVPQVMDNLTINVTNDLNINDGSMKVRDNSIINVGNDLTILTDASLDMASYYNQQLNIGGDWINDNTTYTTWIGFHPGNNSTVTFNGSTDQYVTTQAPQEDFENLVIDNSGGEFRSNDNIHVMGDLDIIAGYWHDNVGSLTHYFEGDFYITSGSAAWWNSLTNNTVVFTGTEDQTVYNPYGTHYFRNIIVDKTTWPTRSFGNNEETEIQSEMIENNNLNEETRALTVTLISSLDIQGSSGVLTIDEGTLDLNGNILYTFGGVEINDGGKIIVDEGAQLRLHDGYDLNVNSGGILEVIGTSGNLATITNRSTGNYDFNVYSGGTISAEYGFFEYMGSNGLYVRLGGLVDPAHAFNYCTFQNGFPGYAPLVVFNNDQSLTCTEVNFPQVGVTDFNAAKASGTGVITFVDAYGDFAGEAYEFDPGNDQIEWTTGALTPIDDLAIEYNDGANSIVLTWTYPVSVDQFKVYRSTDPYDFTGATVFTTATVGYSEPATGTKYFYYVTAENVADNVVTREKDTLKKTEISEDAGSWNK